jgi:hypothetical protein
VVTEANSGKVSGRRAIPIYLFCLFFSTLITIYQVVSITAWSQIISLIVADAWLLIKTIDSKMPTS